MDIVCSFGYTGPSDLKRCPHVCPIFSLPLFVFHGLDRGNLPAGFTKYQHILTPPPLPLTWGQFVNDCGARAQKVSEEIFNQQFKGKVVCWSGLLTSKGARECKFLMNPVCEQIHCKYSDVILHRKTECKLTNSELTLDIPPHLAHITHAWAERQVYTFKGL